MKRRRTRPSKNIAALLSAVTSDSVGDVLTHLQESGFSLPENVAQSFVSISRRFEGSDGGRQMATVLEALSASPDPTGAIINFIRYVETTGISSALYAVSGGGPIVEILSTVFGASQYMSDIIIRNPGYLHWLIQRSIWENDDTKDSLLEELRSGISNFQSVETRLGGVRRFQRRALLKIGVQDLLGLRAVEDTARSLSFLADAIVESVLEIVRLGVDTRHTGFSVLALGKLGGEELNYSSDIDLIYICDDVDDSTIESFHKLGRRLTTALSDVTAEGYLYRVDLRLRPDGDVGPLVSPLSSLMVYYENRGRPWEFQAMLKARVIAGDRTLGEGFLDKIKALALNRTLSYSPLEAISLMRSRIHDNISTRDRSFNIKLMEGGIRDIEFVLQAIQLMHGARVPALRGTNTTAGLAAAGREKLLTKVEQRTLLHAYRFFRLIEHRLQMMHQLKTHSIPESAVEIELLARRVSCGPLGTFTRVRFLEQLTMYLHNVRVLSESFFAGDSLPDTTRLLLLPEGDEVVDETLQRFNFSDTRHAFSILQSLAFGTFPQLYDRDTRASFQRLLPVLLDETARAADPNRSLVNFAALAESAKSVRVFYDQLRESAPLRALIRDIIATSSILTGMLARNFDVIDALRESPAALLGNDGPLEHEWRLPGGDASKAEVESAYRRVRAALEQQTLAAWVCDVDRGSFPELMATARAAAIKQIIVTAFDRLFAAPSGVALLAMGSFATREPRLDSDLDLLVVTRGNDTEQITRTVQTLHRLVSDGGLVKLDFRLRGEGANAPLVQDLEFYRQYFVRRMAPWEKVAFAKCAFWAGDEGLAREFEQTLGPYLTTKPKSSSVASLVATRKKLEKLSPKGSEPLELKRSAGGRYDIEYVCATGLAMRGKPFPLDASSRNRLDLLAEAGILSDDASRALILARDYFDRVDYLLELNGLPLPTTADGTRKILRHLDRTFDLLGLGSEAGLEATLREHKLLVRRHYTEFIEKTLV